VDDMNNELVNIRFLSFWLLSDLSGDGKNINNSFSKVENLNFWKKKERKKERKTNTHGA